MQKRHEMMYSPALGRDLHIWCYGHWGIPILVFPSAAGMAHEWDNHGMLEALAPLINGGKIKLYCPESNISQTWINKDIHPADRANLHKAYEDFIISNLVPGIYTDCRTDKLPLYTAGCSFGGFYAANFALKFPEIFNVAICMSGRYDINQFTDGFSNSDIYLNNPIAYVPNMEGEALARVQQHTNITLVCGRGAYEEGCIEETEALGGLLSHKGIPNFIDIWGHDVSHDWQWWRQQIVHHMNRIVG